MAIKCYQFGLEKGCPHSQCNLGFIYDKGSNDVPEDNKKAFELYESAANQGHSSAINALTNLGIKYFHLNDYQMAIKCYRFGVEKGDPDSQYNLGLIYYHGSNEVHKDMKQALNWFEKASKQRHKEAQKMVRSFTYTNL